ncbi:MAG: Ig-like domain-containing protein [Chloroflexota bacterium]
MQIRRGERRPSHVRLREQPAQPSRSVRLGPGMPRTTRAPTHRRVGQRRTPVLFRLLFVAAIAGMGGLVFWAGIGGVGSVVNGVGGAVGGVVRGAAATSSATPTATPAVADAPLVAPPSNQYTSDETIDVSVSVPAELVGRSGYRVRLYVSLKGAQPTIAAQAPVRSSATIVLPDVRLAKGRNDFTATVLGPGGESESSPVVSYTLDVTPPVIEVSSPTDGQVVNRPTVTITGTTQGRSTVVVRNNANSATRTIAAGGDGAFSVPVPLDKGANAIAITATDPAGNTSTTPLTVQRGSGKLTASLSGSAYTFRIARLPDDVSFRVIVTDPDGQRLPGAGVLFTIAIPGVEAIVSSELTTDANGTASFRARVPVGASAGAGLATVLVTTSDFGQVTDRAVLTVAK